MINTIQSWILFFLAVGLPFALSASALNAAPILAPILQQEEEEDETETEEDEEREDEEREDEEREDEEREDEDREDEEREDEEREDEEREDEEEFLTLDEIMRFAKKHLPEVAGQIQDFIEEEGEEEEVIELILERGTKMIRGFREISERHGRPLGKMFLELFQVNMKLDMLFEELEEIERVDVIKKELKRLVTRRYELELQLEKAELRHLRTEVDEFEEEIRKREKNRDDIIDEQIGEMIDELEREREELNDKEDDREEDKMAASDVKKKVR